MNISGPALASSGIWYQFGQTNFIGANNYPSYPISSNNVSGLGNTFTVTVPAYTIVNLLIPPAPTNTPPAAGRHHQSDRQRRPDRRVYRQRHGHRTSRRRR